MAVQSRPFKVHYRDDLLRVGKSAIVLEPAPPPSAASHNSLCRQSYRIRVQPPRKRTTRPPITVEWTTNCWRLKSGMFVASCQSRRQQLNGRSIQDVLSKFFQSVEDDDPHFDFYTTHKREKDKYGVDCVKKYNEDLNTILIFASTVSFAPTNYLTCPCRQVYSLSLVPPSSPISTQGCNPIRTSSP